MDYLLSFAAHDFISFRELEIRSLLTISGLNQDCVSADTNWTNPYVIVRLPDDDVAARFVERSMLVKSIYSLWASAPTFEELLLKIPEIPPSLVDKYLFSAHSYKVVVSSVNRRIPLEDRLPYVKRVIGAHIGSSAPVSLEHPDHRIHVIFEFDKAKTHHKDQSLLRVYYGRMVGESSRKRILNEFSLSKRTYLGNTTMDVCLAGVIANACLSGPGDIVWDPFLGTGGMVLAASVWGAYGAGNDIDYSLVHGIGASPKAGQGRRTADECLRANYRQYNLISRYLDVLVADAASLGRLLRSPPGSSGLFDAIVTDPPYGVRERSCRISGVAIEKEASLQTTEYINAITDGKQFALVPDQNGLVPVPHDLPHFPHKEGYPLQETFGDLLEFANVFLKPRGRLVFWVPISKQNYTGPHSLPAHPRLRLITVCEQELNLRISRFLMVMEKLMPDEKDFVLTTATSNEMKNDCVGGIPFHLKKFRQMYFQPKADR